jgi:hypothetical protein
VGDDGPEKKQDGAGSRCDADRRHSDITAIYAIVDPAKLRHVRAGAE